MRSRSNFKLVALSELVESMAETYRPDMEASGHALTTAIEPGLKVTGDSRLIQQMLTNLLDNALVHTPPGTQVHLALRQDDGKTRITVADNGPGVSSDNNADLFQRFTRGENSRSSSGHGLGLALVSAIAAAHEGRCYATTHPGFVINIELP